MLIELQTHEVRYAGKTLHLAGDEAAWCSGRFADREILKAIRAENRIGTYVDVGASWGNASVFFLNFCGARQLAFFEPDPERFLLCQANIRRNVDRCDTSRRWLAFQHPAGAGGYATVHDGRVEPSDVPTNTVFLSVDAVVPEAISVLFVHKSIDPIPVFSGAWGSMVRSQPLVVARPLPLDMHLRQWEPPFHTVERVGDYAIWRPT